MDALDIRAWRPADDTELIPGFIATYNGAPWFDAWTAASAAAYLSELRGNSRAAALVCVAGNRLAGGVVMHARTFQTENEIYIDEFFVFPEFQRQGIGRALLAAVREHATSIGADALTLLTDSDKPAFDFYRANGFRIGEKQAFMIG